jgi:hypothetical protein
MGFTVRPSIVVNPDLLSPIQFVRGNVDLRLKRGTKKSANTIAKLIESALGKEMLQILREAYGLEIKLVLLVKVHHSEPPWSLGFKPCE